MSMSYAVQAPPAAAEARRPGTVSLAATLLAVMAVVGLGYAVASLAVASGTVSRYRASAGGADPDDVDGTVFLVWAGAGMAVAIAVLLFALYTVLALGLRRGSNAARITTWVVCALGLIAGCGSALTVFSQDNLSEPGLTTLADAYPNGWVGVNVGMAIAQIIGYLLVAGLLVASPGRWFGRGGESSAAAQSGPYGAYGALPGMPGLYPQPPPPNPYAAAPPAPSVPPGPYGNPYGNSPYAAPRAPEPGPDDEYWSRPSN
jgi:hypothetical protein